MSPERKNQHRPNRRRSTPDRSHIPVMIREVLDHIPAGPGKCVADVTLGRGGHTRAILERMSGSGTMILMDLDEHEMKATVSSLQPNGASIWPHAGNFAGIAQVMAESGISGLDGLLADLGVSSMQIDDPSRGFSYRRDGPLDMRMDMSRGETAKDLLGKLTEAELAEALRELADESMAGPLSRAVLARHRLIPFETTTQLATFCETALGRPGENWSLRQGKRWVTHPAARLFQTLRILVNREVANLKHLLRLLPSILNPGGKACIISFHSGEDRLIKQSFRDGLRQGLYDSISEEPMTPTEYEKKGNPRSRSAKLRWARKTIAE